MSVEFWPPPRDHTGTCNEGVTMKRLKPVILILMILFGLALHHSAAT